MQFYSKSHSEFKRNYHQPPSLMIVDRGCGDSACARHISFLEEERRALAIECDALRAERDALEAEISQLRQPERLVAA
jgi:seryl-tRNA synthetase